MSSADLGGLNAGYVAQMFESYLDAPASVPTEWRRAVRAGARRFRRLAAGARGASPARPCKRRLERRAGDVFRLLPSCPSSPPRRLSTTSHLPRRGAAALVDETLLGGVAAAMALVKAYRMHGHLAARLDPLGSEPMGDPALDESRLVPPLTPELQARIPAGAAPSLRRGRDAARGAPAPPGRLHGLDRVRDRAHLRSR